MEFVQNVMMFVLSHMIPILMNPIFWIMVVLVVLQSRQMQQRQRRIFGAVSYSIRDQLLKAIFYGMIGQFVQETVGSIYIYQVCTKLVAENFDYVFGFTFTHQTMIYVNANEVFADSFQKEGSYY